jgi:hypothetical protein
MRKILAGVGLRYGLVASVLSIMAFLALHYTGQEPMVNLHMLFIDGLLIFLTLGVGMKEFRDYYNNRLLSFGQGMTIGFFHYLTFSSIFGMFILLFVGVIEPDFINNYRASIIEQLNIMPANQLESLGEDFIQNQIDKTNNMSNSALVLDAFVKKILAGLVLTPLVTVIFRKLKPQSK